MISITFVSELEYRKNKINENLKFCGENVYYADLVIKFKKELELIELFEQLANKNNFIITKSPYSNSFYAHSENDLIDWGEKPLNSFRLSDHWNWTDLRNDITHCKTETNEDYNLAICVMTENGYKLLHN